jgi:arginase family enzyme
VYIGLRDVDGMEKKLVRDLGMKYFSMKEVDKYGIGMWRSTGGNGRSATGTEISSGMVVSMAMDHLNSGQPCPLHISFDIDGLDPEVTPSTGTRVK